MSKVTSIKKIIDNEIFYQLIIILVVSLLYSVSINYPMYDLWDDLAYILNNKHLSLSIPNFIYWFKHSCVGCYIPLTMISYIFDYSLWGYNSFGYHLQNVFWHIITIIGIFQCLKLFKIKLWIIFFICLLFAVHPQRVESVVWLSERKDLLCGAFYFWSIYFYLKKSYKAFSIISFILFIMAMLSKPMAISLPIVLLLYEFYRRGKSKDCILKTEDQRLKTGDEKRGLWSGVRNPSSVTQNLKSKIQHLVVFRIFCAFRDCFLSLWSTVCSLLSIYRLWPYFVVMILFIPVIIMAQGSAVHLNFDILGRVYIILYNIFWYFKETLIPTSLNPVYPFVSFDYTAILMIIFYFGILLLIIVNYIKNKHLLVYYMLPLGLCYLASILPVAGVVRLGYIDYADRYSYIPSVFIWFILSLMLNEILYSKKHIYNSNISTVKGFFIGKTKLVFVFMFCYLMLFIAINYNYQKIWRNQMTLFFYSSNQKPTSMHSLVLLAGVEYQNRNYSKILEISDKLNNFKGGKVIASYFKAVALFYLDRQQSIKLLLEIEPVFKKCSEHADNYFRKYIDILALISTHYNFIGEKDRGLLCINKILAISKLDYHKRLFYLGLKEELLGNYKKAVYWYKIYLSEYPYSKVTLRKIEFCKQQSKIKK